MFSFRLAGAPQSATDSRIEPPRQPGLSGRLRAAKVGDYLAAKPHGLVAMWMPGNVATLPMFSLVPALLAKNVCLVKLALPDPTAWTSSWPYWPKRRWKGCAGPICSKPSPSSGSTIGTTQLNEQMSLAADAKIVWGGAEAVRAISLLPRREHCVEIVFGPKYSIGLIGRKQLEDDAGLDAVVAAFVRDMAIFDQRACSAPQTIFVERNGRRSLRQRRRDVRPAFARLAAETRPSTPTPPRRSSTSGPNGPSTRRRT